MGSQSSQNRETSTLRTVKRAQTEPKAAWAGAMVETSSAVVRTSMARFSLERVLSRPSCCWESAIAEGPGSWEGTGWAQAVRKILSLLRIYRETPRSSRTAQTWWGESNLMHKRSTNRGNSVLNTPCYCSRRDIRLGIKGTVRKGLTIGQTVREEGESPLIPVVDDYDSALTTFPKVPLGRGKCLRIGVPGGH